MNRKLVALGAALAALGVLFGAFGAHALPQVVPSATLAHDLDLWKTAAHYHLMHAVALVVIGFGWSHLHPRFAKAAAILLLIGIAVFCGTVYGLGLEGPRILGAITPIGGLCFISGWVAVAIAAWRGEVETTP